MGQINNLIDEELLVLSNALNTIAYLFEAIQVKDLYSAKLELEELKFAINRLEILEKKREQHEVLTELISEMRKKGMYIDFASQALFLKNSAKNAVGNYQNNTKNIKRSSKQNANC